MIDSKIDRSLVIKQLLKNQVLLGSVNAGKKHWELAIADLQEAISNGSESEIKTVITWEKIEL